MVASSNPSQRNHNLTPAERGLHEDVPFALRWSRVKGWIRFRDPHSGLWDEVWNRDMPAWRGILLDRLRDDGRLQLRHQDADADATADRRFVCSCGKEHEPCTFGLGLDCKNGMACLNPHHGRGAL